MLSSTCNVDTVTPELLPCDVIFVYGDSVTNRIVEFGTHGPSHVALVKNATTLVEAQAFRTVGECPLSFYDDSYIEVWRDLTLSDGDRSAMLEYAASLYGCGYDYRLLPLVGLHSEFGVPDDWYHEHGRFICSTFVDVIGKHVGRQWARYANPAPVDLQTGGRLLKMYRRDGGTWAKSK